MSSTLLVGHLISGSGTTMNEVAERMQSGELGDIRPAVVIADRVCEGLKRAKELRIPTALIEKSCFKKDWAAEIERVLLGHKADIVFQNGWRPFTPPNILDRWKGDIYNQHPGILSGNGSPDFGGSGGMCGTAVTAARILYLLETNEQNPRLLFTESTIHEVTEKVDEGQIVRIMKHSLADTIWILNNRGYTGVASALAKPEGFHQAVSKAQEWLLHTEHENVAQVLADRARGYRTSVQKDQRANNLDPDILERVKRAAIEMYPTK